MMEDTGELGKQLAEWQVGGTIDGSGVDHLLGGKS